MAKDYTEIGRMIADSQVAVGTYPDPSQKGGNGTLVIKGQYLLNTVAGSDRNKQVNFATIPCDDVEEAEALRQRFG